MVNDVPPTLPPPTLDALQRDVAITKMNTEALHEWLSRMPTRGDLARTLARTALGIIFCSAVVTTLLVRWFAAH